MSIFNFQFGDFEESSPNWFDWFSLILNLLVTSFSIYFAFYLGEKTYKRDRDDKIDEEKNNIKAEKELFNNNLIELKENISIQIGFLSEYLTNRDLKLKINPSLQIYFLEHIDLKTIYKINEDKLKINKLLSSLYSIENITTTLSLELTNFITKLNSHQSKFKIYRQAYYRKFFDYSNSRAEEIIVDNGVKKWRYNENDKFMEEFAKLRNNPISNEDGTANYKLIDENFLLPLIELSNKFIPEDYNAIEIHDLTNDSHSAFIDIENLTELHFKAIENNKKILEETLKSINEFI